MTTPTPAIKATADKSCEEKLRFATSQSARQAIALQIIEDLIDDPDHEYDCGMEADYTTPLTDKIAKFVKEARAALATPAAIQAATPILTKDEIRAIFVAHGFTVKPGETDLKQYVFDAADALVRAALAAPTVQLPISGAISGAASYIAPVGDVVALDLASLPKYERFARGGSYAVEYFYAVADVEALFATTNPTGENNA